MKHTLSSSNYLDLRFLDEKKRDLLLILPGGGYVMTSEREAGPVAQSFQKEGLHTAVYYYRENKLLYPEVLQEGKAVLDYLKQLPQVDRIFVIGFSAGGHFAAMLLTRYPRLLSAGILAYPLITSDIHFRHEGSFLALMGDQLSNKDLKEVSPERHVTEETPPCFIWITADDHVVKPENAMIFAGALRAKRVPFELHIFPKGRHGLSLCTQETPFPDTPKEKFEKENASVAVWVNLAKTFLKNIKAV